MTNNKIKTVLTMSIAATIILGGVAFTSNTFTDATAQITNQKSNTSPCVPQFALNPQRLQEIIHILGETSK